MMIVIKITTIKITIATIIVMIIVRVNNSNDNNNHYNNAGNSSNNYINDNQHNSSSCNSVVIMMIFGDEDNSFSILNTKVSYLGRQSMILVFVTPTNSQGTNKLHKKKKWQRGIENMEWQKRQTNIT